MVVHLPASYKRCQISTVQVKEVSQSLTNPPLEVVDVEERKFFLPCGPWPEDPKLRLIGHYQLRNIYDGARGVGWKMLRASGMETDAVELLISQVETEATNRRNHSYGWM
jgi:hypothetical protein